MALTVIEPRFAPSALSRQTSATGVETIIRDGRDMAHSDAFEEEEP
jgi:hypothetical protein